MLFNLPDWLHYEIKERWERIEIRKWINKNPRIIISITLASGLMLLVAIGISIPEKSVPVVKEYKKGWFYDTSSGELFIDKSDDFPFVDSNSDTSSHEKLKIVRAYVFSYVSEPNESEQFIGFLEIPDPNFKPESADPQLRGAKRWGQGKLIRRLDDEQWVPANSSEGQYILSVLFRPNENGQIAQFCQPE